MGERGARRVDGPLVGLDPTPVPIGATQAGDLVFIGTEDTEMGALIAELDGCAFSHVGVIDDPVAGTMLSARTDREGDLHRPDLGGVRRNELRPLAGRGLFVGRLALPADVRDAGLARLAAWREDPTDAADPASRSRFSFVKLIAASAALASVRRRSPLPDRSAGHLWAAATRVAHVLRSGGTHPGFYCAEVVAEAYLLDYTTARLWVPDGEPHPVGVAPAPTLAPAATPGTTAAPVAPGATPAPALPPPVRPRTAGGRVARLPDVFAKLYAAFRQIGLERRQAAATARLVATLLRVDPDLGWRLVMSAVELRPPPGWEPDPVTPTPLPGGPSRPPPFLGDGPLPRALVTPRMLLSGSVVSSVHPLDT